MDAVESLHPVPAAWLHDSDLAPFVSAYVRRLVDRGYATNTVRMYVVSVRPHHLYGRLRVVQGQCLLGGGTDGNGTAAWGRILGQACAGVGG
jgi:hypothetical protein